MSLLLSTYSKYEDTEALLENTLPADWNAVRLKHLAEINMGQSPSSNDYNHDGEGFPFLQGNAEFGQQHPVAKQHCNTARKIADSGSFLFSVRAPVGAINIADQQYGIGRGLCAIMPNERVHHGFLGWALVESRAYLDAISTGSTFEAVSAEQVGNIKFPLPAVLEQKQIAAFLDYETAKIDALIEKQQQLIALLGEKRQAVISHAVTKGLNPDAPMRDSGIEWLGEVPEHWTVCRLKHVIGFLTSGPRGWSDLISDDGSSVFLQSGDLNDELGLRLDTAKRIAPPMNAEGVRTKMEDGDVVCCVTGANTGRVAVATKLDQTVFVNQHLALIRPRPDLAYPRFLGTLLAATPTRTYFAVTQYGLKEGLSLTNVAETPICLPPISEQEDIVNYLDKTESKMRRLREIADDQVQLLQERRTALISAAVTGKIDVRGWKPPSSDAKQETEMEVA